MKNIKVKLVVRNPGTFEPRYLIDSIEGALTVVERSPGESLSKREAQTLIDSPLYAVTVRKPSLN